MDKIGIGWIVVAVWMVCLLLLRLLPVDAGSDDYRDVYQPQVLIDALDECAMAGGLRDAQIELVKYACGRIRPRSPEELAYIAACCVSPADGKVMVDEYVRRAGDQPGAIAVGEESLKSTRGIIMYREQAQTVVAALTGKDGIESDLILSRIVRGRLDADGLYAIVCAERRPHLARHDFERIVADIRWSYDHGGGRSMRWCLSVAGLACAGGPGV